MARSGLERDVTVIQSDIIQPVDIQSRYSQTIQTHSGVTVAPTNGYNDGVWLDTDGFSQLAMNLMNDGSTNSQVTIYWSADGVTYHGAEYGLLSGAQTQKSGIVDTKARYARVRLHNTDVAPHVMSAWAFLKA
jgi:hypothetical protein